LWKLLCPVFPREIAVSPIVFFGVKPYFTGVSHVSLILAVLAILSEHERAGVREKLLSLRVSSSAFRVKTGSGFQVAGPNGMGFRRQTRCERREYAGRALLALGSRLT